MPCILFTHVQMIYSNAFILKTNVLRKCGKTRTWLLRKDPSEGRDVGGESAVGIFIFCLVYYVALTCLTRKPCVCHAKLLGNA